MRRIIILAAGIFSLAACIENPMQQSTNQGPARLHSAICTEPLGCTPPPVANCRPDNGCRPPIVPAPPQDPVNDEDYRRTEPPAEPPATTEYVRDDPPPTPCDPCTDEPPVPGQPKPLVESPTSNAAVSRCDWNPNCLRVPPSDHGPAGQAPPLDPDGTYYPPPWFMSQAPAGQSLSVPPSDQP